MKIKEKTRKLYYYIRKKKQTRTDDFEMESCQSALFKL